MTILAKALSPMGTLQAPGAGLLTVSTGVDPHVTLGKYFGSAPYEGRPTNWKPAFKNPSLPIILGYPCDTGAGIVRGSAHGPLALREALYRKNPALAANDFGDVPVIPNLLHDSMLNKLQLDRSAACLYAGGVPARAVSPLSLLEEILFEILSKNPAAKALVLGGDHSMSGAILRAYKRCDRFKNLAILQIDAHTDLLEERFGIEHCFATWSAHTVRAMTEAQAFVQVGLRSSRHDKTHWESKFGLKQFWSREVAARSPKKFAETLLAHWAQLGCDKLYISNDIDGTDCLEAPSTGTPEPRGLKSKWICEVFAHLSAHIEVIGADIAEVAPVLGSAASAKKTVSCARNQMLSIKWHT